VASAGRGKGVAEEATFGAHGCSYLPRCRPKVAGCATSPGLRSKQTLCGYISRAPCWHVSICSLL
jgi:hypothetical protein